MRSASKAELKEVQKELSDVRDAAKSRELDLDKVLSPLIVGITKGIIDIDIPDPLGKNIEADKAHAIESLKNAKKFVEAWKMSVNIVDRAVDDLKFSANPFVNMERISLIKKILVSYYVKSIFEGGLPPDVNQAVGSLQSVLKRAVENPTDLRNVLSGLPEDVIKELSQAISPIGNEMSQPPPFPDQKPLEQNQSVSQEERASCLNQLAAAGSQLDQARQHALSFGFTAEYLDLTWGNAFFNINQNISAFQDPNLDVRGFIEPAMAWSNYALQQAQAWHDAAEAVNQSVIQAFSQAKLDSNSAAAQEIKRILMVDTFNRLVSGMIPDLKQDQAHLQIQLFAALNDPANDASAYLQLPDVNLGSQLINQINQVKQPRVKPEPMPEMKQPLGAGSPNSNENKQQTDSGKLVDDAISSAQGKLLQVASLSADSKVKKDVEEYNKAVTDALTKNKNMLMSEIDSRRNANNFDANNFANELSYFIQNPERDFDVLFFNSMAFDDAAKKSDLFNDIVSARNTLKKSINTHAGEIVKNGIQEAIKSFSNGSNDKEKQEFQKLNAGFAWAMESPGFKEELARVVTDKLMLNPSDETVNNNSSIGDLLFSLTNKSSDEIVKELKGLNVDEAIAKQFAERVMKVKESNDSKEVKKFIDTEKKKISSSTIVADGMKAFFEQLDARKTVDLANHKNPSKARDNIEAAYAGYKKEVEARLNNTQIQGMLTEAVIQGKLNTKEDVTKFLTDVAKADTVTQAVNRMDKVGMSAKETSKSLVTEDMFKEDSLATTILAKSLLNAEYNLQQSIKPQKVVRNFDYVKNNFNFGDNIRQQIHENKLNAGSAGVSKLNRDVIARNMQKEGIGYYEDLLAFLPALQKLAMDQQPIIDALQQKLAAQELIVKKCSDQVDAVSQQIADLPQHEALREQLRTERNQAKNRVDDLKSEIQEIQKTITLLDQQSNDNNLSQSLRKDAEDNKPHYEAVLHAKEKELSNKKTELEGKNKQLKELDSESLSIRKKLLLVELDNAKKDQDKLLVLLRAEKQVQNEYQESVANLRDISQGVDEYQRARKGIQPEFSSYYGVDAAVRKLDSDGKLKHPERYEEFRTKHGFDAKSTSASVALLAGGSPQAGNYTKTIEVDELRQNVYSKGDKSSKAYFEEYYEGQDPAKPRSRLKDVSWDFDMAATWVEGLRKANNPAMAKLNEKIKLLEQHELKVYGQPHFDLGGFLKDYLKRAPVVDEKTLEQYLRNQFDFGKWERSGGTGPAAIARELVRIYSEATIGPEGHFSGYTFPSAKMLGLANTWLRGAMDTFGCTQVTLLDAPNPQFAEAVMLLGAAQGITVFNATGYHVSLHQQSNWSSLKDSVLGARIEAKNQEFHQQLTAFKAYCHKVDPQGVNIQLTHIPDREQTMQATSALLKAKDETGAKVVNQVPSDQHEPVKYTAPRPGGKSSSD